MSTLFFKHKISLKFWVWHLIPMWLEMAKISYLAQPILLCFALCGFPCLKRGGAGTWFYSFVIFSLDLVIATPLFSFSFVTHQWQRHLIRDAWQNASTLHPTLKSARGIDGTPMTQPCTITILFMLLFYM